MKRIKYFIVISFIFSISIQFAQENVSLKLDSLMKEYNKMEIFSGVVLLAKDGNEIYKQSFGFAHWDKNYDSM